MRRIFLSIVGLVFLGCNAPAEEQEITLPDVAKRNFCIKMARDVRVRAFLDLLAWGEGTDGHPKAKTRKDAYCMTYCGTVMSSFKDHPRVKCCFPIKNREKDLCSDASGRYMWLSRTWDWVRERLGLSDFSPAQQDIAAVFLIDHCGALKLLLEGDTKGAINASSRFWAPMPGNQYGQPQKKLQEALAYYKERLRLYESLNAHRVTV